MSAENETQEGFITFGPKDNIHTMRIQISYVPTTEQIRNLQNLFGWDYETCDENKEMLKKYYGHE